jgi:hypothetical protein
MLLYTRIAERDNYASLNHPRSVLRGERDEWCFLNSDSVDKQTFVFTLQSSITLRRQRIERQQQLDLPASRLFPLPGFKVH